jgi:hypothetical protein
LRHELWILGVTSRDHNRLKYETCFDHQWNLREFIPWTVRDSTSRVPRPRPIKDRKQRKSNTPVDPTGTSNTSDMMSNPTVTTSSSDSVTSVASEVTASLDTVPIAQGTYQVRSIRLPIDPNARSCIVIEDEPVGPPSNLLTSPPQATPPRSSVSQISKHLVHPPIKGAQ